MNAAAPKPEATTKTPVTQCRFKKECSIKNIARVRNCPDVPILNSLFGLCLVVVFVVVVFVVVVVIFVVVVLVVFVVVVLIVIVFVVVHHVHHVTWECHI